MRERRHILTATATASVMSGLPSTLHAIHEDPGLGPAVRYLRSATRAAGTLLPPGRPGFARGVIVHIGMSVLCGEILARTLPRDHTVLWGAGAGAGIGVLDIIVIGRHLPAIHELPAAPQIADHVALGVTFAFVVARNESRLDRSRPTGPTDKES